MKTSIGYVGKGAISSDMMPRFQNSFTIIQIDLISYFPRVFLEEKTDKIRTSKTFSRAALAKTKERYYPNLNVNELEKVLRQANIAVSENQPVQFSEAEKKVELKKWQERGFEEFKKVVIVRTTFTGDAMGTNSNK